MRLPLIRGTIDRRVLANYRVDPDVLARLLPPPFRPKLHHGYGMAGICLIRLKHVRPRFVPRWLGVSSENAAHRVAVEWDDGGVVRQGVYVRRRDTNSWLNAVGGGRVFPGIHSHARFATRETGDHVDVALRSDDGRTVVSVIGDVASDLTTGSVFGSVTEASEFFRAGSLGYSATPDPLQFQGLELRCRNWRVEPLRVTEVRSSYFDDPAVFPPGSVAFDSALLMRGIEHEWHGHPDLICPARAAA
jgi:uncharacterized protein YqjF (DUF2071 family)